MVQALQGAISNVHLVSERPAIVPDSSGSQNPRRVPPALARFGWTLLILCVLFAKPLYELVDFVHASDTLSYILLVPFISLYLAWLKRPDLANAPDQRKPSRFIFLLCAFGMGALGAYWLTSPHLNTQDRLSLIILAFVCFVIAAAALSLRVSTLRSLRFPLALLAFFVPPPLAILNALEVFFQYVSADAASALIQLSGLPAVRDGLFFRLPGLSIQVAQECSGIRSTLVLLITSLLAGHLFLCSPWKRAFLALFVIPLAIIRNGFRIWSLAWLSVEVDPNIIDSVLHRRGGPIFFALSLIPFFLLLLLLRKFDRQRPIPNFSTV